MHEIQHSILFRPGFMSAFSARVLCSCRSGEHSRHDAPHGSLCRTYTARASCRSLAVLFWSTGYHSELSLPKRHLSLSGFSGPQLRGGVASLTFALRVLPLLADGSAPGYTTTPSVSKHIKNNTNMSTKEYVDKLAGGPGGKPS